MPVNEWSNMRPAGGMNTGGGVSAAQQTLYDYWRTLLMEEERNAARNERLLRKLEDIEERTNLLYHRTERLSQLRRRFAEMLRQQYLNDPEFKCENFPAESKENRFVAPSYVPDPILFGLDTPPWMPCEDDLLPLWRSKEVLERMECVYKGDGRPRTQEGLSKRDGVSNAETAEEEKKDKERDTSDEAIAERCRDSPPRDEPADQSAGSQLRSGEETEFEGTAKVEDHREEKMNDDLREIDRKVDEIDREIERLEMEVRDRETLRRWESENNERYRHSLEEKLRLEDEKLRRIREERNEMREMAGAARRSGQAGQRRQSHYEKDGSLEDSDDSVSVRDEKARDDPDPVPQPIDRQDSPEERVYGGWDSKNRAAQKNRRNFSSDREGLPGEDFDNDKAASGNGKIGSRDRGNSVDEASASGRDADRDQLEEVDTVQDTGKPSSRPDSSSLTYVSEKNEFYRTTAELEELRRPSQVGPEEKDEDVLEKGIMESQAETVESGRSEMPGDSEDGHVIYQKVPKSGQHTPRHNVLQPGPGILKNKDSSLLSSRRPSFIPRRSSSALVERDTRRPSLSNVALTPSSWEYPRNGRNNTFKTSETLAEHQPDLSGLQEGQDAAEPDPILKQQIQHIEEEVERRREKMQREMEEDSVEDRRETTEAVEDSEKAAERGEQEETFVSENGREEKSRDEAQEAKGSWQSAWEENQREERQQNEAEDAYPEGGGSESQDRMDEEVAEWSQANQRRRSLTTSRSLPQPQPTRLAAEEDNQTRQEEETIQESSKMASLQPNYPTESVQNLSDSGTNMKNSEVVPMVLSPRTVRSRRIAEAEKETKLNELANALQSELQREIFQRQLDQAQKDPTEFINTFSCYLPSMRNPNINVRRFQRDVHTPNLEELNIKKTSQVLISGIHGAPESGCSDSSPPPRGTMSPQSSNQRLAQHRPSLRSDLREDPMEQSQNEDGRSREQRRESNEVNVNSPPNKDLSVGGSSTLDMRRRSSIQPVYRNSKTNESARPSIVSDPNINSATKESETSSRSDTPSSSIELNCSKDDGKDARSEYAFLMGKKAEESPKPTAIPLPLPSHRPSLRPAFATEDVRNETVSSTQENDGGNSQCSSSSPIAYSSEFTAPPHVKELITKNVKHHVPSLVAKRVLGLDLYSGDAPRPKDSDGDEDSFFD